MRGRIKKLISALCTVAMVFSIVMVPNKVSFAATPDGVSTRTADQDVIVSVTDNAVNNTVEGIEADLKNTISASGVSSRTRVSTTDIDVTDLSKWYVYDRYDTKFAASESAYLQKTGYNKALRPYYGVTESYNGVTEFDTSNNKFKGRNSQSNLYTSIPDILEADRVGIYHDDPSNMESDGSTQIMPMDITSDAVVNAIAQYDSGKSAGSKIADIHPSYQNASHYAYPLKEHIYAYQQDGKANMFFYGYGNCSGQVSGFDFLYYPALPNGTKKVDYTVDASNLTVHSLGDSGFFFNCGIKNEKKSGSSSTYVNKLYGYYLGFTYKGSTSSNPARTPITSFDKAYLYKLNGVDVDTLHKTKMSSLDNNTFKLFGSNSTNISKVAEISLASCNVSDYLLSDIALEITSTSLKAKMTAHDDPTKSIELFDKTGLDSTGFGGFGPAVEWGVASHQCAVTSTFEFSDLKMKIIESESVLNGFCYADFTQKVEKGATADNSTKYFVLIGDTEDKTKDYYKIEADRAYLELLKKEHVILITNLPIEPDTIGMGGTDYSLKSYLGDNNVFQISGETDQDFADAIADIIQAHPEYDTSGKYTDSTGAKMDILDASKNKGIDEVSGTNCYLTVDGTQLSAINTTFIGNNTIRAEVIDDYSINVMSGTTKKIKYILSAGDGTQEEITWGTNVSGNKYLHYDSTKKQAYIDIDKNSAVGDYTLTLVGVANANDSAIISTTGFAVGAFYDSTLNGEPYADGSENDHVSAQPSSQYNDVGKYAVSAGKEYKLKIVTDTGYDFESTGECVVTVDGVTLTPGTDYTLTKPDNKTRIISIISDKVTGDIDITTSTVTLEYEADVSWAPSTDDVERKDSKDLHEEPITAEQDYVVKVGIKEANKKERALADTVTVKVGGVEVKPGIGRYVYNSKTGTITVKKAIIGGNIEVIVGSKARTEFDVIPDVTNVSFDGEDVATVGTDYEATITPNPGYDNPTTITVTVDGVELEAGTDYTYDPDTGAIVISGDAIGYDVKIVAVGTPKTYDVTNTIDNATYDGEDTASYNSDYEETITPNTYYHLPETITVKVGNDTLEAGTDYTYDSTTGEVSILGTKIIDNVVITAAAAPDTFNFDISGNYVVSQASNDDPAKMVPYGTDKKFTIVPETGYALTDDITVKVGGVELNDYTFDKSTGELTIPGTKITDTIEIVATTEPKQYDVTNTVTNITVSDGSDTIKHNEKYTETLVPNTGYNLPDTIKVLVDGTEIANDKFTYDKTTGELEISAGAVTGHIEIKADGVPIKYPYSVEGKGIVPISSSDTEYATYGNNQVFDIELMDGYLFPDTVEVKIGDKVLDPTEYTYDPATGKLTVPGEKITDKITVVVNAIPKEMDVTYDLGNITYDGPDICEYGKEYKTKLTPGDNYDLPDDIVVKVGDKILIEGQDYSYNPKTGELVIFADNVTGKIKIEAVASPKKFDVVNDITNGKADGDAVAAYKKDYKEYITPLDDYDFPSYVVVTVGGNELKAGIDYAYTSTNGELVILGEKITGKVVVKAAADKILYKVKDDISNGKFIGDKKVEKGKDYKATIKPADGYALPDSITVTVDGKVLKPGVDYTYNPKTGEIVILNKNISGTIEIIADNVKIKQKSKAENNIDLNAKLKVSQVKSQVNVSWGKVDGADLYEVYVTYCGNKYPKKPSFTTEKNTNTNVKIKKIDGKKLNLKKNYKLFIKVYRYDEDGDKILIAESIKVHFVGRLNKAYTNVKEVKTDKSKYSIKKGQTVQIKAKNILASPKKKQLSDAHAKEFRYASTDAKIASVNKRGVIKAKKAGKCYVYVYARNGFAKKIQVTVK